MSVLPDGRKVNALKVTELKKELEIRGLSRSGAKRDLAARLSEHLMKENAESGEIHATCAQVISLTTEISESSTEAQNYQKKDNDDQAEYSLIESDGEAANASTGTVIFVPKELSTAHVAPTSDETALPCDGQDKNGVNGDQSTSLTMESDMSMPEPDEVLNSSTATATDSEPPTTSADEGQPPASSTTSASGETKGVVEAESHVRRRNLWGARSDAASAGQTDKHSSSLVSFSTDTLEKMVPTLTVVDKKPLAVGTLPPETDTEPVRDTLAPEPITGSTEAPSEVLDNPSPPSAASTPGKQSEVAVESTSECVKHGSGFNPLAQAGITVDEEVLVMDATIEGGLDVDSAPVVESQKPPLEEVNHDQPTDSVQNQDTRQVTRKRPIEATGAERKQSPSKRKGLKETKAVGYLIEQPERVEPCKPTSSPTCEFVHITCLVRPFTADQLKQMITSSYGQVVDLWLNRIKSASVVQFESTQAAVGCREGLDGSRWPSINPRVLRCDFVSQEFFNWMKQYGDMADMHPPKHLLPGSVEATADPANETRKADDDRVGARCHARKSDDLRQKLIRRDSDPGASGRGKSGASGVPSGSAESQAKSEPSKMLDDLFRKTTTSPCIYWLPLTEEEAQKRAVERAELAAKRGGTRATRSPFAAGGEVQRSDTAFPTGKPTDSEKAKIDHDVTGANAPAPLEKISTEDRQSTGRDALDGQKEHRREGSPFMVAERKLDNSGRPTHRGDVRDGFSGIRRQKSSRSSSSSPRQPSKRARPYREASPRRKPGPGDYSVRRRSSRSRSRSGGGGRYRGRLDSSADAYRRRRAPSPHLHRSRR